MFLVTLSPLFIPRTVGRTAIIPSANNAGKKEEGGKTYKQVSACYPGQPQDVADIESGSGKWQSGGSWKSATKSGVDKLR